MSLLLLLVLLPFANAECPSSWTVEEVRRSVSVARGEADPEGAAKALSLTLDRLACPAQLLRPGELTDLFTLGAALSNQLADPTSRDRFLTAAAVADGAGEPRVDDAVVGADIAALYRSRFAELHRSDVTITVRSPMFVDGIPVFQGQSVDLAPGDHVLQYIAGDGVRSEVISVASDAVLDAMGPDHQATSGNNRAVRTGLGATLLALGVGGFWTAIQLSHEAGAVGGDRYVVPAYVTAIGGTALVAGGLMVFVLPSTSNGTTATAGLGFSHAF